jgi:hypothetical protein
VKVYMIWQGGINYAVSDIADAEEFPSLAAAVAEFTHRASGTDPYYPCVEGSEGHIFHYDPRIASGGDHYPDRIITSGPRGGVRVERC